MPASSNKHNQAALNALIKTSSQHLFKQFPHHEPRLKALLEKKWESNQKTDSPIAEAKTFFKPALPQDEVATIVQKTQQLSLLPGLSFDSETELYLEQQLEDMMGFSLSHSLNSLQLPFTKGLIESLPHLYASPTRSKSMLEQVPEAGLSNKRSYFGWHIPTNQTQTKQTEPSRYWISLPLRQWTSDSKSIASIKQWIYRRKLLLINPTEALFTIAEVQDEYTPASSKFQLGASPAIIREGLFWSPQNLGKVMVFFLSDSGTIPEPGVYSLF